MTHAETAKGRTMIKTGRSLLLAVLIIGTVGCDRVTKHVAQESLEGMPVQSYFGDTIRLDYAENTGGFLSMGANLRPALRSAIFSLGTGLMLVALLIVAINFRRRTWCLVGACLALAGGVSNLFDRIANGAVIDFLNVGLGDHLRTGIFNVADVAILAGICIIVSSRPAFDHLKRPSEI
jgi:signal peptidase II